MGTKTRQENKATAQENKAQFQDGSSEIYIERHGINVSFEKANELLDKISAEQIATLPIDFIKDQIAVQLDNTFLIEQLEQEKNKKSNQRREKKTPYQRFTEKAQGKMADGIRHMIDEIVNNKFSNDKALSTTVHNMSRRYGPVTLAVLYQDGWLSQSLNESIEKTYPNKND